MKIKPVILLTLGDPAGVGPELIAKLLSQHDICANATIVLIGDEWLWAQGQQVAQVNVEVSPIGSLAEINAVDASLPFFYPVESIDVNEVEVGVAKPSGGKSVLAVLDICLDACEQGLADAICFAPLNKQAMIEAGMPFEDELHYFANRLKTENYFCEFNTLGNLWTSRISSHVPLKDVAQYLDKDRIIQASKLIHDALVASGIKEPRVAVAAFNPHGGDGGVCGREEIDIIQPAVEEVRAEGYPVEGPFPADTIFLKARDGHYDAIVTMYHDQGQIAIKLLGFERGVTLQGGLSLPITTPAHGTAYDIAGKNKANAEATIQAFRLACRMGASQMRDTQIERI